MNISGDDSIYRSQYIQKIFAFLFVLGIMTGTLALNIIMTYRGDVLVEEIQTYHNIMKNTLEINMGLFSRILFYRIGMALFLYLSMQMTEHCYIFYPVLFLWGNSFGYTLSLLSFLYGWKGLVCMILYMVPHYMIYLPLIILILRKTSSQIEEALRFNFIQGVVILLLIFVGSGAESYINPMILKNFLNKFL